jgi:hypothetical protein
MHENITRVVVVRLQSVVDKPRQIQSLLCQIQCPYYVKYSVIVLEVGRPK